VDSQLSVKVLCKPYSRSSVRGTVHCITVKGHKYHVGVVKVNKKAYATTTCSSREMAEGALKQMIVDKKL